MKDTSKIIAQVSNTTKEEVEREIAEAISVAMKSTDPKAKAFWQQVAPDGKQPSTEVVIKAIAQMAKMRSEAGAITA